MKYLLLSFLISMNVYSQESVKCQLHLDTVDREDLGMVGVHKHEGFMKLLEDKGYEVILVLKPAKAPPVTNLINLKYFEQFNCMNEAKSVSISFGSKSWKNNSNKWVCPGSYNSFVLEAQSNGEKFKTEYSIKDFFSGVDFKKRFQTLEEAQDQVLRTFNKLIPTCIEVRSKLPDAGKKEVAVKEASKIEETKAVKDTSSDDLEIETVEETEENT